MDEFQKSDLMHLLQPSQGPCVTLMMPTHPSGPDAEQDALRLKNLADHAQELLSNGWMRACQARDMLEPVRQIVSDKDYWETRSLGLALFLQPDSFNRFRVPVPLQELSLVNHRFFVKPLLRLVSDTQRFLVLTVSQHHIGLYDASEFSIQPIDVPGMPQRLIETLNIEGADRGQQQHLANRFGKGKQTSVFHGQGGAKETHKSELSLYFNQIDKALAPILRNQQAPLLLTGVDYLLPILRKSLSYTNLLDAEIHGNYDHSVGNQLLEKAWPLVKPTLMKEQITAAEKFLNLSNTELATSDPQTSIKAAFDGRVDTLFVDVEEHLWGSCDRYGQVQSTHMELHPGDDDLLDSAAAQTLLHGGKVFTLTADQMPSKNPIAALLRF